MKFTFFLIVFCLLVLGGCASSGAEQRRPLGESSEPINEQEYNEYRKALTRCYKTGGSRIVKIKNYLRCY